MIVITINIFVLMMITVTIISGSSSKSSRIRSRRRGGSRSSSIPPTIKALRPDALKPFSICVWPQSIRQTISLPALMAPLPGNAGESRRLCMQPGMEQQEVFFCAARCVGLASQQHS